MSFVDVLYCAERTMSDRAVVVLVSFRVGFVFIMRSLRSRVRVVVVVCLIPAFRLTLGLFNLHT